MEKKQKPDVPRPEPMNLPTEPSLGGPKLLGKHGDFLIGVIVGASLAIVLLALVNVFVAELIG